MSKGKYFITFAIGAISGSVATYVLLKNTYEQRVQEETKAAQKALREYYRSSTEGSMDDTEHSVEEYTTLTEKYVSHSEKEEVASEEYEEDYISILSPDEFGEYEHYRVISLDYFSGDNVLVDSDGNVIDISDTIGEDALNHFGEYDDDDVVYVRNENINTDFEVLLDHRKYSEVFGKNE